MKRHSNNMNYKNSSNYHLMLSKLFRYYYAVAEFDSIKTAQHIYDECDGREIGFTGNYLDLRYVPDEVEFNNKPK